MAVISTEEFSSHCSRLMLDIHLFSIARDDVVTGSFFVQLQGMVSALCDSITALPWSWKNKLEKMVRVN